MNNAGHKNKSDATHTFRTNHMNDYTYLTSCKYEHIHEVSVSIVILYYYEHNLSTHLKPRQLKEHQKYIPISSRNQ